MKFWNSLLIVLSCIIYFYFKILNFEFILSIIMYTYDLRYSWLQEILSPWKF